MIRVLLDTDHVSLHERGHLPLRARLAFFLPEEVTVSVVTVAEMLRGRLAILARRAEGEARVHAYAKLLETVQFFSTIPVVPFDLACEHRFQALRALRLRVGSRVRSRWRPQVGLRVLSLTKACRRPPIASARASLRLSAAPEAWH